jgi:mannose-6-phosphate isomerase-like protein (cupin superfamily)
MDSTATSQAFVLTAEAISRLRVEALGSIVGVKHRVVWRTDRSMAGVMTVEGGHRLGTHRHRANQHHMWVLHGHARILGVEVGPGSYAYVPSGADHDIDASETEGCTVLYLYLSPDEETATPDEAAGDAAHA